LRDAAKDDIYAVIWHQECLKGRAPMSHTDRQLDQLETLLTAMPAENDGMLLGELDGFIAGILLCPEPIPAQEWLAEVWGDAVVPHFTDLNLAAITHEAVLAHRDRVVRALGQAEPDYGALYDDDPLSGEVLWETWITGFERAMRLRPDAWGPLVLSEDEDQVASLPMLVALHEIAEGTSALDPAAIAELSALAPDLIPALVLNLHACVTSLGVGHLLLSATAATRVKAGRNDPCPCGSGRKYKKCCGAGH
jgi:uncharacterized protein